MTARHDAVRRLLTEPAPVIARPSVRRRALLIGIPALAVAVGVGGAAFALTQPVTDLNSVHCFSRAEIDVFGHYPGTQVSIAAPDPVGGPIPIEDAVAVCSDMWRQGLLSPDWNPQTSQPDTTFSHAVPAQLTVCVMRDGTAAVIPGDEAVCSELGLANRS